MISANIDRDIRRAVYQRDGWRCVLCDSTKYLQIHHGIPKSRGGDPESMHNLVTLCSDCHALAHGTDLRDTGITRKRPSRQSSNTLPITMRSKGGNRTRAHGGKSTVTLAGDNLIPGAAICRPRSFCGLCAPPVLHTGAGAGVQGGDHRVPRLPGRGRSPCYHSFGGGGGAPPRSAL